MMKYDFKNSVAKVPFSILADLVDILEDAAKFSETEGVALGVAETLGLEIDLPGKEDGQEELQSED